MATNEVYYEYVCTAGHTTGAPNPLTKCYGVSETGGWCKATLKQTLGPRGPRKAAPTESVSEAIAKLPEADRRALAPMKPRAGSKPQAPPAVKVTAPATPTGSMLMDGLVKAYQDGAPLASVAATAGVAVATMREQLVAAGVTIRGRGRPRKA